MSKTIKFPQSILKPVADFLRQELDKLKKQKKEAVRSDIIRDPGRLSSNSLEEDVDEQLSHQNTQMRVGILGKQIVQVRKALSRLKLGKYGVCESCGQMIDTDRLSVYPETTLCLKCQEERE